MDIKQTSTQVNLSHKVRFIYLKYNTADRKIFIGMKMCSTHIVSLKKKSQLQISILICENLGKCFPLSDSQAIRWGAQ